MKKGIYVKMIDYPTFVRRSERETDQRLPTTGWELFVGVRYERVSVGQDVDYSFQPTWL